MGAPVTTCLPLPAFPPQVEAYKAERAGTEGVVKEMGAKTVQLQAWLGRNEAKASVDPDTVDMAAVFVAADEYSAQSLAATAADLAAEDVMLVLDKALQSGMLPLDAYLKQVREGVWVGGW